MPWSCPPSRGEVGGFENMSFHYSDDDGRGALNYSAEHDSDGRILEQGSHAELLLPQRYPKVAPTHGSWVLLPDVAYAAYQRRNLLA